MIKGLPKIDGIYIGEFSVNFMGAHTLEFKAKAAFVNSRTGETHGWTTNEGRWSPAVIEKLKELRAAMEADLGAIHFEGGGEVVASPLATRPVGPAPTGIGEHLSDGGVEQA